MPSGNFPAIGTLSKEVCSLTEKENTQEKNISEILTLFRHFM